MSHRAPSWQRAFHRATRAPGVHARAAREIAEARGDRELAIGARLWELLVVPRRGKVEAAATEAAITEAAGSGVTLRPL